jgi:hypothetical protein
MSLQQLNPLISKLSQTILSRKFTTKVMTACKGISVASTVKTKETQMISFKVKEVRPSQISLQKSKPSPPRSPAGHVHHFPTHSHLLCNLVTPPQHRLMRPVYIMRSWMPQLRSPQVALAYRKTLRRHTTVAVRFCFRSSTQLLDPG